MATRKRPRIKLTGGPHGIPREIVQEVQRGRMLDAAADVIAEEGYLDATVHKILKRAGISRRTFYEIFKDKQDCFLEAYREAVDQALGEVREACAAAETPEERVEGGLRALLAFAKREPKLARMCVVEVMAAGEEGRVRRAETMDRLTALAADALEQRCEGREEALLRARVLTGGVHEMVYDALARGRSRGLAELADDVVASYLPPPEVVHGG